MLCKECSLKIPEEEFYLCTGCMEESLIRKIREEQEEEGFKPCFKTGAVFCDHGCKYEKLCLLKDWADGRAVLDACRSIQYIEGSPACCGKYGETCSLESKCLFGALCIPKNIGFRWLRVPKKAILEDRFKIIDLAG